MQQEATSIAIEAACASVQPMLPRIRSLVLGARKSYAKSCIEAGARLIEIKDKLLTVGMKPRHIDNWLQRNLFEVNAPIKVQFLMRVCKAVEFFGGEDPDLSRLSLAKVGFWKGFMVEVEGRLQAVEETREYATEAFREACETGYSPVAMHKKFPNKTYRPRSKEATTKQRKTTAFGIATEADPRDLVDMIMAMIEKSKRPWQVRKILARELANGTESEVA